MQLSDRSYKFVRTAHYVDSSELRGGLSVYTLTSPEWQSKQSSKGAIPASLIPFTGF